MPALMVRDRMHTLRMLGHREATTFRNAAHDVRERIRGHEPRHTRGMGGVFGRRGSILKTPVAIVSDTVDNILEVMQDNARINRRQLLHARRGR